MRKFSDGLFSQQASGQEYPGSVLAEEDQLNKYNSTYTVQKGESHVFRQSNSRYRRDGTRQVIL